MKSLIITGTDVELNNALNRAITNYSKELEIVYASPYSSDLIENIGFSQPDFIIADYLNEEQIKAILEVVIKTTIVFISKDTNRTNAVISNFNKEGVFTFINLDKSQITPKTVLEQLINYDVNSYKEVTEKDNYTPSTEPVENPMVEEVIPTVESNNETTPQNDEVVIDNTLPKEEAYTVNEEVTEEKPMENFTREVEHKENSEKITNITQCQLVTVYSKKGGTGKTTFAKEIANIFANATLSKRISEKGTLETCLVDFDFERGNLRTMLGITNPNPNVYTLIDSILSKMEQGIPLDKIYFAEPEFKINYCIRLKNSPMYVLCLGQGDIPKRLIERMMAFGDDEIFEKIIKKIIGILKNCFNVVVFDTSADYNDINDILFRSSSKIIYPLEPTLLDLDNLKTTLDETKNTNYITTKLIPVVNKGFKSRFNESFVDVYEEIMKHNDGLRNVVGTASYSPEVVTYNNNYGFIAMNTTQFKTVVIALCHNILPIFKSRNLSDNIKVIQKKKEIERKKAKALEVKEATKKLNEEKKNKKKTTPKDEKQEEVKSTLETVVEEVKNVDTPLNKEKVNDTTEVLTEETLQNEVNQTENIESVEETSNVLTLKEYVSSDLSKKDIDTFVSDLKACSDISLTKKGFPKLATQPKTLNKKVWKQYYKLLSKNLK